MGNVMNKLSALAYLFLLTAAILAGMADPVCADDFVLGPEDIIQISVWGNPDLGVTVPIRPDGKISIPLGGDMQAAGRTASDLRNVLTQELRKYIKDPWVSVVVTAINSTKVYLVGNHPSAGAIPLRSNMTALQFLAQLGSFDKMDLENAYIIRNHVKLEVNLKSIVEGLLLNDDFALMPGDIIRINLLEPTKTKITVIGEVAKPANIIFRSGMTILDALLDAGWVTEYANLKRVLVVRKGENDAKETIEVNVAEVTKGENLKSNILLAPGDLIIVKERVF